MTSRAATSAAWTTVNGLTVTAEAAFAGAFGARANDTGGADVWARKTLASPAQDVTTTVRFKVDSRTTAMHMLRLRSVGNAAARSRLDQRQRQAASTATRSRA